MDQAQQGDYSAFSELVSRHQQRLYSIAYRILGHKQDAEDAVQTAFVAAVEGITDWSQEPAQLLVKKETHQLLNQFIDQLDEKHRLVFILRDIAELTTKETSELLSISVANVKVRLL